MAFHKLSVPQFPHAGWSDKLGTCLMDLFRIERGDHVYVWLEIVPGTE